VISRRDIGSVEQSIEGRTLSGVAAVYNQQSREISEFGRTFREQIAPGAFAKSLGEDIKLLYNHDPRMPLARTRAKTLSLMDKADGLHYVASLPETTLGNDVRALIERGDLSGEMSFGFYVEADEWNKARTERTVRQAKLVEVSIVVDAAYPQTTSSLRHVDAAAIEAAQARLELHIARLSTWTS
jgi:HK97 family phage prohead protease